MNDPSQQHIGTPALIRRFAPYLMRYKRILIFDLFFRLLGDYLSKPMIRGISSTLLPLV